MLSGKDDSSILSCDHVTTLNFSSLASRDWPDSLPVLFFILWWVLHTKILKLAASFPELHHLGVQLKSRESDGPLCTK